MGLIAFIANIAKILSLVGSLFNLIKNYKLLISIIVSCLIIIASCLYFLLPDNKIHEETLRHDRIVLYIDDILKRCKDKTAITVGTVSIRQFDTESFWPAKFKIARACDESFEDCLINLKDLRPTVYREKDFKIDPSSYELFVNIGDDVLPTYFNLRGEDGTQDLQSISFYPSIRMVLEELDWFEQGIIEDLWITTILNRNSDVLYVITLLSAKPQKNNACFNQNSILIKLREYIKLNSKY